jgi:hypothetical protein
MAIDEGWIYCGVGWVGTTVAPFTFPSLYRNCSKCLLKFCNSMQAREWKGELSLKRGLVKSLGVF